MEVTLRNGNKITFNEQQIAAYETAMNFFKGRDLFLCISGSAGSGKTTLLLEILNQFRREKIATAPTHKAKKVISTMTGLKSVTIHSLIGLKPDMNLEEFSEKNMVFSMMPEGNEKIGEYGLVCIDESSMINKDLVKFIKEKAKAYGTKILFLGDPNQLPPVKEDVSTVFTDTEIIQVRLTKVERQKDGNPLMNIYDAILSNINSPVDLYKKETELKEGFGYQFFNKANEFGDKITDIFKNDNNWENKILCWTNDKVRKWNNYCRLKLVGDYDLPLQLGEIIMCYRSVIEEGTGNILLVQNSAEYRVIKNMEGEREGYSGNWLTIEDIDTGVMSSIFMLKNDEENYRKFLEMEKSMKEKAKTATKQTRGFYWKQYYQFRDKFFLFQDILGNDNKPIVKKDFDYSYALTVHKSQGSTYKNVFIDDKEMSGHPNPSERNRLKYVAYSRPTNAAYCLI